MTTSPRRPDRGDAAAARWPIVLAILLAMAGGLHIAALPSHLQQSPAVAAFFVTAGVGQFLGAGFLALRSSRSIAAAVVVGNLAILAVWTISRSVGMPFGPRGHEPETISAIDAMATMLEAIVVAGALLVVRRAGHQIRPPFKLNSGVLATLALVWVVAGGLGTTLADAHGHVPQGQQHPHPDSSGDHRDEPVPPAPGFLPTGHSSAGLGGEGRTDLHSHVDAEHQHPDFGGG